LYPETKTCNICTRESLGLDSHRRREPFKKDGSRIALQAPLPVSSSRTVALSGLVALLIALSAVALISLSGVPPARLGKTAQGGVSQQGATTATTGPASGTLSQGTTTTSSSGTSTASSQGQASGGQGVLSILLTDPPRVPQGVTAVYVYYIGLAVHGENGWTTIKQAGAIELLGTVGQALTLSSGSIPAGTYDSIRFEVASAQVTYQGTNHSAIIQGGQLTVRIVGDAMVSGSQAAAALIDIQPTVINVGTSSSPQFVLWAEARAFQVPSDQAAGGVETEGHSFSLKGNVWWDTDQAMASASLQLSGVSLSSNSLSLDVKDVGSSGTWLKLVVVSSSDFAPGTESADSVPAAITSSAVFVVLNNGTLVQFLPLLHASMPFIRGEDQGSVFDALLHAGYNLTAGASVHFSYSGSIELSFGLSSLPQGITSGTTYWITVIGDNTVATTSATAT